VNHTIPCRYASMLHVGDQAGQYPALRLPTELPAGLVRNPRVLQLINLDSVSRGLANGTDLDRASDRDVQRCLGIARATARVLDPQSRIRCTASTATAAYHLDVLTASGNNEWLIRHRLDGVNQALIEEMTDLIDARLIATAPGRGHPAQHADLVILVGQDQIYASPVRRLRLLGIPTWLMVPGHFVAAPLYACSCAVSFLGPDTPGLTTGDQLTPPLSPQPLRSRRNS
jgi:hypothetical protein